MNTFDERDPNAVLRIGSVLDPETICNEAGIPDEGLNLAGYCLSVWTPSAVADALKKLGEPGTPMNYQLDVLGSDSERELIALFVVQSGAAQMRLVMPLADPSVQDYLSDCTHRGRLRLWVDNQATQEVAIVDLPGGVRAPSLLKRLMEESRGVPRDRRVLLELGRALCPLDGVRSLISGINVEHAVTVLVCERPAIPS
ncbi:MAG: hypothetical protein JO006_11895 [Paucibacter sp.]|nr:hypothetical protein [Roseateles sp.]